MDLDSFLVSLYVLVDDWWRENRSSQPPKPGRPSHRLDEYGYTITPDEQMFRS